MKVITVILILALTSLCWSAPLPNAPVAQHTVEHDPGAWAFTTGFTAGLTGTFTKPWIGLAAGVAVAVLPNMQNSNNARQNMVGGIGGAAAGYLIIKTLKNDWKHHAKRP